MEKSVAFRLHTLSCTTAACRPESLKKQERQACQVQRGGIHSGPGLSCRSLLQRQCRIATFRRSKGSTSRSGLGRHLSSISTAFASVHGALSPPDMGEGKMEEASRWHSIYPCNSTLSLSLSLAISLSLSPGHGDVSPYSLSLSLFALLCLGLEAPAVLTPRALGASRPTLLTGGAQLYGGHMDQTEW